MHQLSWVDRIRHRLLVRVALLSRQVGSTTHLSFDGAVPVAVLVPPCSGRYHNADQLRWHVVQSSRPAAELRAHGPALNTGGQVGQGEVVRAP